MFSPGASKSPFATLTAALASRAGIAMAAVATITGSTSANNRIVRNMSLAVDQEPYSRRSVHLAHLFPLPMTTPPVDSRRRKLHRGFAAKGIEGVTGIRTGNHKGTPASLPSALTTTHVSMLWIPIYSPRAEVQ